MMPERTDVEQLVGTYDVNSLIGAYKMLEAKIDEVEARYKEAVAPLKEKLQQLSGAIAIKMDENKLENVRTSFGTAYFAVIESIKVTDKDVFFGWVIANEAADVLTSAVSREAIRDRRDRGEEVPGLEITPIRKLHIRKPS